jgi:hypothetical protein
LIYFLNRDCLMLDFMAQHGKHRGWHIKLSLLTIWR